MKKITAMILICMLIMVGCGDSDSTGNKALDGELDLESNQSLLIAQVTVIYGNEITLAIAEKADDSATTNANAGGTASTATDSSSADASATQDAGGVAGDSTTTQGATSDSTMPTQRTTNDSATSTQGGTSDSTTSTQGATSDSATSTQGATSDSATLTQGVTSDSTMPTQGTTSDSTTTSQSATSGNAMPSGEAPSQMPSGEAPSGMPSGETSSDSTTSTDAGSDKSNEQMQMTRYVLTGEEKTMTIPVGTPVTTLLGTVTTFSRIAVDNTLQIVTEKNSNGEDVIVAIYIVG